MIRKIKPFLINIATYLLACIPLSPAALAEIADEGGYHIRFVKGRTCLANAYDKYHPLDNKPCRTIGDDPSESYDAFGPFYVLTYILDHDEHKWLVSRLTGDCISATPSAFRQRPYADMCRPGSIDQKWEFVRTEGNHYRVRHAGSGLCLGYTHHGQQVRLLPCHDEHTEVAITLQDPYPSTDLPPYPPPHDS